MTDHYRSTLIHLFFEFDFSLFARPFLLSKHVYQYSQSFALENDSRIISER